MAKVCRGPLAAVVANDRGEIFDLDGYAAVGMAGGHLTLLQAADTSKIPYGSELMRLPDRRPIAYNRSSGEFEVLTENPMLPGEAVFPVAAFNSPGYILTHVSAFREGPRAGYLPLFSYGAVGWQRGNFRSAILQVDREPRQDLRQMQPRDVAAGVRKMRKMLPGNRLRAHLEHCALVYGCPAGKNFFLGRYEAPLPASRYCNARCLGCLSLQPGERVSHCQDRIGFTPDPEEIAAVAIAHIQRVKHSVVSFGQGCEGDPLLAAEVIEPAIRLIRSRTAAGTINMNTNASRPEVLAKLFAAGLDSMRVSLNSVRKACYEAYFRPKDYRFEHVLDSVDLANRLGKFVSLNYLNCPGVTDAPQEFAAFKEFLGGHPVHLIQWRNLNFDPLRYWRAMAAVAAQGPPMGIKALLAEVRGHFPDLRYGYFNPPKERFHAPPGSLGPG
jgi:pyruvate-formate lyase-activating enzyme